EGEEAHGLGFYEKRAQRAAARAIDAMPRAQKPDPIAGDTPRDSSNGYAHSTHRSSAQRLFGSAVRGLSARAARRAASRCPSRGSGGPANGRASAPATS